MVTDPRGQNHLPSRSDSLLAVHMASDTHAGQVTPGPEVLCPLITLALLVLLTPAAPPLPEDFAPAQAFSVAPFHQ